MLPFSPCAYLFNENFRVMFAGSSGVSCNGIVTNQRGTPLYGVTVTGIRSDSEPVSVRTVSDGRYSMSGLECGSTVQVIPLPGYTIENDGHSQQRFNPANTADFVLYDDSH